MILPFSTQLNGKPTYFVEKIHSGLLQNGIIDIAGFADDEREFNLNKLATSEPKLHTIRKDEKNRWKVGNIIDFFINARQKNMFRFAPRIPVIAVQHIDITNYNGTKSVHIDGRKLGEFQLHKLAVNDGFASVKDFFEYFNECFSGKLIHWTNLKY